MPLKQRYKEKNNACLSYLVLLIRSPEAVENIWQGQLRRSHSTRGLLQHQEEDGGPIIIKAEWGTVQLAREEDE